MRSDSIAKRVAVGLNQRRLFAVRLCGLALLLFAEGLGSFRQLLRFDVLFVRGYEPAVARRILYATASVAVEHIRGLHHVAAAGLNRLLVNPIDVRNVLVEA